MKSAPTSDDSFVMRICKALDEPPRMLAANLGVDYADLYPLLVGGVHDLVELDRDEVWWKLSEYVAKRTGDLMAIREELNRKLQKDRVKRASKFKRLKDYNNGK